MRSLQMRLAFLLVLAFLTSLVPAGAQDNLQQQLPVAPDIKIGKLENGLT